MLHRANEDLKEATIKQQEETEEWKGSCDRLSSSLARKESESAALKEKLKEANEQVTVSWCSDVFLCIDKDNSSE